MTCNGNELIKEAEAKLAMLKEKYTEKVEPVEKVIQEHPIPAVLIGVGAGILIGALIYKYKCER